MSVIIRLQGLPWSASALDIRNFFQGLGIPAGGVHIIGGEKGDAFIAFSTDEDARQAMNKNFEMLSDSVIKLFLSSKTEMQNIIEQARAPSSNSGPIVTPELSSKVPDPHGRPMDGDHFGREGLPRGSKWGEQPKDSFPRREPGYQEPQSWFDGQKPADFPNYPRNDDVYPDPGNYNYGQQDAGFNRPDQDVIPKDTRVNPHEMKPPRPELFIAGQQKDFRGPPNVKPTDEPFPPELRGKNWQNEFDGSLNRGPREDIKYGPNVRNPQTARYEPQSVSYPPDEPDDIPQFDEYGRQIFPEQRPFSEKQFGPAFNKNERPGFLPPRNAPDNHQIREGVEPGFQKRPILDDPDLRKDFNAGPPRGLNSGPRFGNEFVGSNRDDRDFRNAPRERRDFGRMDGNPDFHTENAPRNNSQFSRPNMDERMPNSSRTHPGMNQDHMTGFPPNQGAFSPADNYDSMNQGSNANVPPDAPRGTFGSERLGGRPDGPGRFGPGEQRGRFPPDGPRQRFPPDGPVERFSQDSNENFSQDVSGERFPPDRLRERFPPDGSGDRYPADGPRVRFPAETPGNAYPPDGPGGRFPPERLGRGRPVADGPQTGMPQDIIGGKFPPEGPGESVSPQLPRSRILPEGPVGRIPLDGSGSRIPPEFQGRNAPEGPGGRFPPDGPRGRIRPGGPPFRGSASQFDNMGPEVPGHPETERPGFPDADGNMLQEGNALVGDDQPNPEKWKNGRPPYGDSSLRPDIRPPIKPGKGLLGDAPPLAKPLPEDKDNRDPSTRNSSSYDNRNMGRTMSSRGSDDGHSGGGYGRRGNPDSGRMSSRDYYRDRDTDRSRSRGRYDDRDHDRRSDSYYRSDRRLDDHSRSSRYSDRDSRSYSERERDRDPSRRDRDSRSEQSKTGSDRDRDSRSSQSKSATDKDSRTDSKTSTDKDNRGDSRGSKRVRSEEIRNSFHVVLHSMSSDVSYREVRRFFAPIEIPFDGLKLINDEHGRRTGQGYIKFASEADVTCAMKKTGGNMNGKKVEIRHCTKEDYENAVDSFIPDTESPPLPQKRLKPNESDGAKEQPQISTTSPFIATLKGLPPKITKPDVIQFLSGITIAKGGDAVYIDIDEKGIGTGTVFVEVTSYDDLKKVYACECRTMGPRLIRVSSAKKEDIDTVLDHQKKFSQFENNLVDFDNRKVEFANKEQPSLVGKPPDNDADARSKDESFFVCMNGLPPLCTQREIREFCHGLTIAPRGLQICHDGDGKPTGEAFLEFHSKEHFDLCLQLDKQSMGHNQISVVPVKKLEMVSRMRQARLVTMFGPTARNPMQPLIPDAPDPAAIEGSRPIPPGVLKRHWFYLRCSNLPLSVTIREILSFFQGHNPVPESIRLHYTGDGHPTGNAVVGFESRDEAMKAMHELNNALCRHNNVVINPASY